jgi:hypothetical protein
MRFPTLVHVFANSSLVELRNVNSTLVDFHIRMTAWVCPRDSFDVDGDSWVKE